jgi:retron-type reverse transcriptase
MNRVETITNCDKTLQLIRKSLRAGYIHPDTGEHIRSSEGTPQGSVFSPLLANIVLDEFDKQVEKIKASFEKGRKRTRNREYESLQSQIQWLRKSKPGSPKIKELAMKKRLTPAMNMFDPNFKRMMFLRYADDFVILISGSIDETKHIKHRLADVLTKKCGLELHDEKTLITATKDGFKFLGS